MGWLHDRYPEHEGYVVGLVPVEPEAAKAAAAPELHGAEISREEWHQYVNRYGRPIWWRELSGRGASGTPDDAQPVREIQVGCDCGWRSRRFFAPPGTRYSPSIVSFPDEGNEVGFEDYARRVWRRHCEDSARAEVEDAEIDGGVRCAVDGCTETRGHDGILGAHSKFSTGVRKLYPVGR